MCVVVVAGGASEARALPREAGIVGDMTPQSNPRWVRHVMQRDRSLVADVAMPGWWLLFRVARTELAKLCAIYRHGEVLSEFIRVGMRGTRLVTLALASLREPVPVHVI